MEKGYTLLELVISTAILCIVLLMISGFLGVGLKVAEGADKAAKAESHYRTVMLFLEKNLESKSGVEVVKGQEEGSSVYRDVTDKSCKVKLYNLKTGLEGEAEEFSIYLGSPNEEGKRTMRYEKGSKSNSGKMECGRNIVEVYLEPIPEKSSFREASGLRFTFEGANGSGGVEFEKTVYFKNKKSDRLR